MLNIKELMMVKTIIQIIQGPSDLSHSTNLKVMFNQKEDSITCSCMLYIKKGFLCRHIFYVFNIKEIDIIPSKYILKRWWKDIIHLELLRQTFSNYGNESKMIQDAFITFGSIVNKLAKEEDVLSNFLSNLQEYLSEFNKCGSSMSSCSKYTHMTSLRGASVPNTINFKNPEVNTDKGTGKDSSAINKSQLRRRRSD
ncbi:protein FAR1-RELATED SEQUENCE 1-like [Lactuca sativa]|uniref:protein FAR1-RELATED SEQUENCE 1-like n=1 Tax=Lactuca sativa TaxID=4236 RepID=UPI0022AFBCEF|nr:protein FAR1-RELATED SEQUENCE 1-like [Lactuca sativa]